MHKVFISYHHLNDQWYKDELVRIGEQNAIFIDASVDTGDIQDHLTDEVIRQKIRDEYLRDSTVTILGWNRNKAKEACGLGDVLQYVRWASEQKVRSSGYQLALYR